jgi:hypothetical protein
MGAKVTITWDGLEQMIGDLSAMEEKAPQNIEAQTKKLAEDTKQVLVQNTPKGKTGRLREGDETVPAGMSFTIQNSVFYFDFVSDGHKTARGWRTKRGYRKAKRQSYVEGKHITEKATDFVAQNIEGYLSKFMDNL